MDRIIITIKGDKETRAALSSLSYEFKNFSVPLEKSSRFYLSKIKQNFTDEGDTFNMSWPSLKPVTIEIKRKLRSLGKSIGVEKPLLRTGALRASFDFYVAVLRSIIYSNVSYAKIHNEGGYAMFKGRRVKIPKRVLARVTENAKENIKAFFTVWVNDLIKKYKL